ncbi:methylmalonyl-CoA mutase, partial [Candidatus Acetothermia bacterium]|nr:methylmalonyl-CoA mutase [Candidatus Acetothermia bacterium]
KYQIPKEQDMPVPILRIDPEIQRRQIARLEKVKRERDNDAVHRALGQLADAAMNKQNTMPFILDAVKAYVSVGEIMEVFRKVHGAYREPAIV